MKSPQYSPTAKELVDEFDAIYDDRSPNEVGLVINDRVILVDIRGVKLVEPIMGRAIIQARDRKRNPVAQKVPEIKMREISEPFGDAPPMDFITDEEIISVEEKTVAKEDLPQFDMGRAEGDGFALPNFLEGVVGLAAKHENNEEW